MATAGAVLGLAVDGVESTTSPRPQDAARLPRPVGRTARAADVPRRDATPVASTRTTSASAPNPRGTRPRSKQRPTPRRRRDGMVITVDRGRYTRAGRRRRGHRDAGARTGPQGHRRRRPGRRGRRPAPGAADTLARIVRVAERDTVLRRTADDNDPLERVIVANADQLVIVTRAGRPRAELRADRPVPGRRADRGPRAAALPDQVRPRAARTPPSSATRRCRCRPSSRAAAAPWTSCARGSTGQMSVLVGHSGVGKSTLINALVPDADRAIGVGQRDRQGSAHLVVGHRAAAARRRGWVIDTPGVRSFGLAHVERRRPAVGLPRPRGRRHLVPARLRTPGRRRPAAASTPGSPRATRPRSGSPPSAACSPRTERAVSCCGRGRSRASSAPRRR